MKIYILFATLFSSVYSAVVNNSITLPTNECGYSNVIYNDSLSTFNSDDTVKFYNFETDASNCGPPVDNQTLGCVHLQHMTGPFSMFGYNPYTIWYYPYPINESYTMNLFYNYNGGSTVMIGAVPCDGQLYMLGLTKCAFNQHIFSYQFYKYYLFYFFIRCSYNGTTMNLKIDESADTCVGFDEHEKCIVNHNIATLVDFQDWVPIPFDYAYDTSDFGIYTTSTVELPTVTLTTATITQNVTETATTILNVTESATVTETVGGTNATATITETIGGVNATVTETLSGTNATATITETIGGANATATVTESATITETIGGTNATATVTESATITETLSASVLTITESATITETAGGGILTITETTSATITETLTITETNTTSTNTTTSTTMPII